MVTPEEGGLTPSHLAFEPFSLKKNRAPVGQATPTGLCSAGLRAELRADRLPLGYSLGKSLQPCTINTCICILLYVKEKGGMEEKPHTIKIYFCFLKKERK